MKKPERSLKTLGNVLKYLKHYKILFALSLVFAAASVIMTLCIPLLTGKAIDCIAGKNTDTGKIAELCITAGILIIAAAICQWLMNICNNRITFGIVYSLRRDAFEKIQSLPFSYLDRRPVGDTVSRVISDADQVSDGLLLGFSQFFSGIVTIIGTLIFMLSIQPYVALLVLILTPLSLFAASFIAKNTHKLFAKQAKVRAEQTSLIDEMIGQHKTVVAFSHEEESMKDFCEINDRLEICSRKAVFFSSLTNPGTRFINNLIYAGVALLGAFLCASAGNIVGAFTVGDLSCMLSYSSQYMKPFNEISGVVTELQNALACADRLFELINAKSEPCDAPDARVLDPETVNGKVSMNNVSFSYKPDKELIKGLDLEALPGQRIAIVGPTGCGKTTLINLLMRFYDVMGGCISVSDTDIRDITRDSLRASYGMVLQETWLKPGTIRENIALGKPDATDDEITAAAISAHAHSFIQKLPDGYDTVIGEDGGTLSQGQKQLLCISRIFLCLPPMLILDEATSSIDTRTELKIQNAFAKLMRGRTSFIVAHRLTTVREADLIIVMDHGKIIETGNHSELIAKNGFYAKLYNSQFE